MKKLPENNIQESNGMSEDGEMGRWGDGEALEAGEAWEAWEAWETRNKYAVFYLLPLHLFFPCSPCISSSPAKLPPASCLLPPTCCLLPVACCPMTNN